MDHGTRAGQGAHVARACVGGFVVAAVVATIGVVTKPDSAKADVIRASEAAARARARKPAAPRRPQAPPKPAPPKPAPPKPSAPKVAPVAAVRPEPAGTYGAMIREVFGPDGAVALRIAVCESGLDPNMIGRLGEVGLFQIRPEFHGWRVGAVGGSNLADPATNIRVAKHLFDEQGWRPWSCAR